MPDLGTRSSFPAGKSQSLVTKGDRLLPCGTDTLKEGCVGICWRGCKLEHNVCCTFPNQGGTKSRGEGRVEVGHAELVTALCAGVCVAFVQISSLPPRANTAVAPRAAHMLSDLRVAAGASCYGALLVTSAPEALDMATIVPWIFSFPHKELACASSCWQPCSLRRSAYLRTHKTQDGNQTLRPQVVVPLGRQHSSFSSSTSAA